MMNLSMMCRDKLIMAIMLNMVNMVNMTNMLNR